MDPFTWTHQCWTTKKNIPTTTLYGQIMHTRTTAGMIETIVEKESNKSVPAARLHDVDDIYIYIYIYIRKYVTLFKIDFHSWLSHTVWKPKATKGNWMFEAFLFFVSFSKNIPFKKVIVGIYLYIFQIWFYVTQCLGTFHYLQSIK